MKQATIQSKVALAVREFEQGNLAAAKELAEKILKWSPTEPRVLNLLAFVEDSLNNHDKALRLLDRLILLNPKHPEGYINRGNVLSNAGRFDEALASYRDGVALGGPFRANGLVNIGNVHRTLGRHEKALVSYNEALAINPNDIEALSGHIDVLCDLGKFEEAGFLEEKVLDIAPQSARAHFNNALILLTQGHLEQGWAEYEWRWRSETIQKHHGIKTPAWQGEYGLRDKRILLHAEQGLGDTIQFCRYAHILSQICGEIVMAVQQPLLSLVSNSFPSIEVIPIEEKLSLPFDCHCPLMSLPLALKSESHTTIPNEVPYIRVGTHIDPQPIACMDLARPRVGIVWAGKKSHRNDQNRSIPLEDLTPLFDTQVTFFSLQQQLSESDSQLMRRYQNVRDLSSHLSDFSATARLIEQLDLVISVDTSVAHLCGAMGKPVWIMLPFVPDWRWLLDRTDSPWYPTARLFRQAVRGDWEYPVEQVRAALANISFQTISSGSPR